MHDLNDPYLYKKLELFTVENEEHVTIVTHWNMVREKVTSFMKKNYTE